MSLKRWIPILYIFLIFSCKTDSVDKYSFDFKRNENVFDSLAKELLLRYPNDTNTRVTVIVNEKMVKSVQLFQKVDTLIQSKLDNLQIEQINLEREGTCNYDCFDKVYFRIKQSNYPIVYYIYNRCGHNNNRNYVSKTIIRKPINNQWELLIDKN